METSDLRIIGVFVGITVFFAYFWRKFLESKLGKQEESEELKTRINIRRWAWVAMRGAGAIGTVWAIYKFTPWTTVAANSILGFAGVGLTLLFGIQKEVHLIRLCAERNEAHLQEQVRK